MLETLLHSASILLLLAGSFLSLTFGLGLLRLPDFFSRTHAAGVADTLCAAMILLGLALQAGFSIVSLKLMMILFFLWMTSPTSSYALAHAAYQAQHRQGQPHD